MKNSITNGSRKYTMKEKIKAMGPGIIIVGSFIGPGTITTATRTGATFGYSVLWAVVFSVIATIILQEMSARLGIITQKGLSQNIIDVFEDNPVIKKISIILVSGAITLGGIAYMSGDLLGTSLGISNLTGIPTNYIAPFIGFIILGLLSFGTIKWLEKILGVLVATMMLVFIVTMFVVKPDMSQVAKGLIPVIPEGAIMNVVGLIGTTIVPYNLFIHATNAKDTWKKPEDLVLSRWDTYVSIIIGGIITSAVLITAATVMKGMVVNSAADMAIQLEPTLGKYANIFMSIGLFSAGFSSASITPLGVSYVLSGLFGWEPNKSDKRFFYTNITILALGITGAVTGFNPLTIIIAAQALNGIFLPLIVIFLVYVTSQKKVLGEYANTKLVTFLGILVGGITLIIGTQSVISVVKTLINFLGN